MTGDQKWNVVFSQQVRELETRLGVELVFVWKRRSKRPVLAPIAFSCVGALIILAANEAAFLPLSWACFGVLAWFGLWIFAGALRLDRWVFPRSVLAPRVEHAALDAFVRHEIFATRHRKGVLVYLSECEHLVWVIPDREAAHAIEPRFWNELGVELASAWSAKREPGPWMQDWLKRLEAFWASNTTLNANPTAPIEDELGNRLRHE